MMKRVLCLLLIGFSIYGRGQDFASKFMEVCEEKEELKCQTIGPKMMERLMSMPDTEEGDDNDYDTGYFLSKLKSARIVTAERHGEGYFDRAKSLLDKNRNRFVPLGETPEGKNSRIFVRRHDDRIKELVMLNLNRNDGVLTIINFTGDMDDSFIRQLSKGKKKDDD